MSYELPVLILPAVEAAADLGDYQFHAVKIDSSGDIALSSTAGEKAIGILQNNPDAAGKAAAVMVLGISKAVAGGTVVPNDPVGPDGSGHLIKLDEEDESVLGRCMVGAAVTERFPVMLTHEGSAASVTDVHALTASANYAVTGQSLLMKAHSVAGEFVKCGTAGENVLGVLTNAPAQGAAGLIKTNGPATVTAGTGDFAPGNLLATDAAGKCVVAVAGDVVVGFGLATVVDGSTGLAFLMPSFVQAVAGTALANTKVWIGSAGGAAAAFALSGDVTMTAGGAVTIGAEKVGVAKMASAAQGTLHRGDAAAAVSELDAKTAGQIVMGDGSDVVSLAMSGDVAIDGTGDTEVSDLTMAAEARGDIVRRGAAAWEVLDVSTVDQILVGDGNDIVTVPMTGDVAIDATGDTEVSDLTMAAEARGDLVRRGAAAWEVVPAGVAGQIVVGDGNDPASVAMSGDATIAAGGAVTLAKTIMRQITTTWTSVEIRAIGTPLVLADFTALQGAGVVAAGDALIFHDLVANVYGGVGYDQNENSIIRYQTAGGGAIVSNTLVNWFNGAVDGACTTIKQLVTDIVPEINEDLVWILSADPFAAAGTRSLSVTMYYSVFTPAT